MKKNKTNTTNLFATAALALATISSGFAQANLGSDCGCPAVASRPTVLLSSLAVSGGATDGDLTATNTILSCDKTYILDKKIYVPDGKTITINPGTVIKGRYTADMAAATALIVTRGGKIMASGEAGCQIVFTAEDDDLSGTYGISNRGKWGGVVILGKATNNLVQTNTYGTGTGADGVGFVEGFNVADARNLYGMPVGSTDDNDNSGILKYVSIRHAGALLAVANELNGLSLGSVGRGTTLEHIEVISNDDDGIEFFGGTVNIKYATVMFCSDDMFDWDLGWTGKAQFIFGMKTDAATSTLADNGFESDGDDNKKNPALLSHPYIYNATIIGNGFSSTSSDKSGPAAIMAKELTQGEIYNSVFANFKYGLNLVKALGTRPGTEEAYHNWINGTLKINNCTFVGNENYLTVDKGVVNRLASDTVKFYADGNLTPASIAGLDYTFAINGSTNAVSNSYSAVPSAALTSTVTAPVDGFLKPVAFRGAFETGKKSWMSDWAYAAYIQATAGLVPCGTDINGDNSTNVDDFLELVGKFNQSCN